MLPMCWLCPEDPGPFPEPFKRDNEADLEKFNHCLKNIYRTTDCDVCIETSHTTYVTIREQYKEKFDFDGRMLKPKDPLHKRLKGDLTRSVGKIRTDYNLPNMQTTHRDLAIDMLGRILIYADVNELTYKQGFCDILQIIVHIVFYGLLAYDKTPCILERIGDKNARYELVEALSADIFVKFMSAWPIGHMKLLPPICDIEALSKAFMRQISDPDLIRWIEREKEMNVPGGFLLRWTITLFTHDLKYTEVLKLWDWIFRKLSVASYATIIISVCASVATLRSKEIRDKTDHEIMQEMQKLSHMSADNIVKMADAIISKKGMVTLK